MKQSILRLIGSAVVSGGRRKSCVESLLREGSEVSGDELDHGDADPSFGSLRVSFKVLAQPASKEFAQVTPQTVVNGLPRAAAMPGSSRKRSKMLERRAATDVIGKPRADSSQSALNAACISVIRSCLSGFVDGSIRIRFITPMGFLQLDRVDDRNLDQVGLTGRRLQEQEGFGPPVGREGQPLYQLFMGFDRVGSGRQRLVEAAQQEGVAEGQGAAHRSLGHGLPPQRYP